MKKLMLASLCALSMSAIAIEERTVTVQHLSGAASYFSIQIQGDELLDGVYPGWCLDWARQIEDNVPYNFKYYSSLSDSIPAGLVDHPENLDENNWLINQHFVGKNAGNGLGVYTSGDVQLAIWTLLDDSFQTDTVGPFSQARVDKIVAQAKLHNGYVPRCRDYVGIIIDPGTDQTTVIEIPKNHFPKCEIPDDNM